VPQGEADEWQAGAFIAGPPCWRRLTEKLDTKPVSKPSVLDVALWLRWPCIQACGHQRLHRKINNCPNPEGYNGLRSANCLASHTYSSVEPGYIPSTLASHSTSTFLSDDGVAQDKSSH